MVLAKSMRHQRLRSHLKLEAYELSGREERFRAPDQFRKKLPGSIHIFLFLVAVLGGNVNASAQDAAPEKEKKWVPGNPVTNESVEAGLLTIRQSLRASPAFQKNDAPTHLRLAEILSQQGDPNGAIEEYQAAIQLDPTLAEAYRGLGAVHIDTHQWSQAESALRTSARLDSTDSQTFYWLGRALMAQHKFSDATAAFTTATDLNPQDAEGFADLGLVRMAQNHSLEADKALTRAIQLRPDFAEAHHRLEILRASQQDPKQPHQGALEILNILFRRE